MVAFDRYHINSATEKFLTIKDRVGKVGNVNCPWISRLKNRKDRTAMFKTSILIIVLEKIKQTGF